MSSSIESQARVDNAYGHLKATIRDTLAGLSPAERRDVIRRITAYAYSLESTPGPEGAKPDGSVPHG